MDEEKKPKKKVKEKVDKAKTSKKEKKKSSDLTENDEQLEEAQPEEVEEEEIPVKVPKGVRNKFVEDELKSFKDNFYLLETGNDNGCYQLQGNEKTNLIISDQSKVKENARAVDESFPASPQATFTQVKSKKNRVKKPKEEDIPPPQEVIQRRFTVTPTWSRESDVERGERREVRASSSSEVTDSVMEKTSLNEPPVPAAPPPNLVNDFPALPGGGKKTLKSPSSKSSDENQAQGLPCAWSKVVIKASDIAVDNTDTGASDDHEANHEDFVSEENDKTITVINECDDIQAVIDINVPKESEENEDSDDADTVVSDATPNCDEPTNQVEVITTEDEFERKEVNKESPVVIFSENTQDWTSSEFSFGFEVNEDLVATASAAPEKMEYVAESQPQTGPVQFWPGAIDSMDNAILSFGAAGPVPMPPGPQDAAMRPLIVGVPVGVPFPVAGFYPHQMIPGGPVPPYPQVYNIPFPHQMSAEEDHEIMAEKNLEDHTISPESGISSSSPLSWQPDSSPSLPAAASKCHLPLASQVRESLSQWSGHSDHEDTEAPGWATQVEAEVDTSTGQDSGLASENSLNAQPPVKGNNQLKKTEKFNFVEIVNFISNSWSNVSEDTNVQVFSVKAN